jgi:hypothetical protein
LWCGLAERASRQSIELLPSDRVRLKKDIGYKLASQPWVEIDLTLEEFGANTSNQWNGDQFGYVIEMLRGMPDDNIRQLAQHLKIAVNVDTDGRYVSSSVWEDGQ